MEHRTDAQSAPEVLFTTIITAESLVAASHALGRKPEGKTAIKVQSGESEKSNNLNPSLVKDLLQEIGGTLVECATA
ncbi:ferredoxin, partial [Bifidobacterium adolescentis]|nr:ferredoxin [Bifidobacterium adolescentis]